jgi:hypothetical protein
MWNVRAIRGWNDYYFGESRLLVVGGMEVGTQRRNRQVVLLFCVSTLALCAGSYRVLDAFR